MIRSTIASSGLRPARSLVPLISIALALPASHAAAEPSTGSRRDAALAEALFREGRKLMNERRFSEACPKLEESQRLDPGSGTLLNLGICHANQGKTATAWAELREALGAARRDGRADREGIAKKQLAELEPRMSMLTVEVPEEARVAGLTLKLDGRTLSPAAWGSALPIDPGDHEVEAEAPRRLGFTAKIAIKPEHDSARVTLPVLREEPAVVDVAPSRPPEPSPESETSGVNGLRVASLVLGGAGLAGIGVGSGFGVNAILKEQKAREKCPKAGECVDSGALQASADAKRSAKISDIAFAAGGAALVAGVVLFILSRRPGDPAPSAARFFPVAGPSGGGAVWQGTF